MARLPTLGAGCDALGPKGAAWSHVEGFVRDVPEIGLRAQGVTSPCIQGFARDLRIQTCNTLKLQGVWPMFILILPPLTIKYCRDWLTPPNAKLERGSASTSVLVPLG